ncbi:hypothetical protein H0H81_007078 [Sphagnurus paluster]|uniref:Uncharacterized protein n=1 Tax=Sphagnurus paluster TaxID=117069 RepID=A0A9P7KJC8_9AGAR|nr:hypothetical protein H0H81_007078 [Sphagnurus paluster]
MICIPHKLQQYSSHPLFDLCCTAARKCFLSQYLIATALLPASLFIYEYIITPTKLEQYILEPIVDFAFLAAKQYLTSPILIGLSLLPWAGGFIYDHIIVPRLLNHTAPEFVLDDGLPIDDSPYPSRLPVKIGARQLSSEETCPFIISLKVGKEWSVPPSMNIDITPTQEIYLMADWTKSKAIIPEHRFLSVNAELEDAPGLYSPKEGYRELGQHVTSLGRKVPFERWGELTVRLPAELGEIEYPSSHYDLPQIPADELRNLHWLTWSGHRAQLTSPSSWLPFSQSLLHPLISLTLTCGISLDDFSRIICCGTRLQNLEIHSIDQEATSILNSLPGNLIFPCDVPEDRPNLESLTLSSSVDIAPVFSRYILPALRTINFDLSCGTNIRDMSIAWRNLREVIFKWDILNESDSEWLRLQSPHARHEHINVKSTQPDNTDADNMDKYQLSIHE